MGGMNSLCIVTVLFVSGGTLAVRGQFTTGTVPQREDTAGMDIVPLPGPDTNENNVSNNLKEVVIEDERQHTASGLIPADVITARQFSQYTPADIVPAINQDAGVYIQSGAINTNRITIRGVGSRTLYGSNKVRAYFNGIPVTNGTGETVIDIYNPEDLAAVEIVKGPKATLYGSSLGGTMLLTSRQVRHGEKSVYTGFTVGSSGLVKNSSAVNLSLKKWTLHLNYDHLQSHGFRENSTYVRNGYVLQAGYRLNKNNRLNLLYNHVYYRADIPSSIGETAFRTDPSQAAPAWAASKGYEKHFNTLAGFSLEHRFGHNFSNTSSIFYNYSDHYEPRPFNILTGTDLGYGARTVFTERFAFLAKSAHLDFGGEWYRDLYQWNTIENLYALNDGNGSLEGARLSDNLERRNQLSAFASLTLPLTHRLTSQWGVNVNKTGYDFNDQFNTGAENRSASRSFGTIIAPGLTLAYSMAPTASVFANASRGFNYPTLEEALTPEGAVNPGIDPETGWNYELGSDLFLHRSRWHINASVYWMDIRGLLVAERIGADQYIGRNAGRSAHRGIEVNTAYLLPTAAGWTFKPFANAAFNFQEFVDFKNGDEDFSGNALTGVPDRKVSAGLNVLHRSGGYLTANYLYVGSIPMNDANTRYSEPYEVVNVKAGYGHAIARHWQLDFSVGINNVLDEKYASSILVNATATAGGEPRYYYPGNPRNFYTSLRLGFLISE